MEDKQYTMRNLKADDMFAMMRIINKIGLKDVRECFNSLELKQAISNEKGKDDALVAAVGMQVMFDVAALLVGKLPECKDELYSFLASLSGMKAKEIADLPMTTFYDMLMDVFKQEGFKDFFQRVAGSFK